MPADEKKKSSVKSNMLYQMLYRVLTILTPLITSPILSRALGAENLGIYSATLAYSSYFTMFAMLGIENHGNRTIASYRDNDELLSSTFWNIYAMQFVVSLCSFTIYLINIFFLSNDRFLIYLFQGIWILGCSTNISWYFFGTEQFKLTSTRNVIVKVITVMLIVLFVKSTDDLLIYTLIMAGDSFLSNLILWPFLVKKVKYTRPTITEIRTHIKPCIVLFIPVLALTVFHVMDKTMLDMLSTEENVGLYYSADKIINLPLAMISAIGAVLLPRVANSYSKGDKQDVISTIEKSTEVVIFLTCAVGIGIAAIAKEFVPFFFGQGFEGCVILVYWFVPVLFVKAIGELIRTQYLIPAHKDKAYIAATFAGAIVNAIVNYFFIIKYEAKGAVIATLIAEFVVTVIEILVVRKEIHFLAIILKNISYILFSMVMLAVVRFIAFSCKSFDILPRLLLMVVCGGITYGIFCLVFWKKTDSVFRRLFDKKG